MNNEKQTIQRLTQVAEKQREMMQNLMSILDTNRQLQTRLNNNQQDLISRQADLIRDYQNLCTQQGLSKPPAIPATGLITVVVVSCLLFFSLVISLGMGRGKVTHQINVDRTLFSYPEPDAIIPKLPAIPLQVLSKEPLKCSDCDELPVLKPDEKPLLMHQPLSPRADPEQEARPSKNQ